eukprot:6132514-Alexandrium_andersonii.AAC.1
MDTPGHQRLDRERRTSAAKGVAQAQPRGQACAKDARGMGARGRPASGSRESPAPGQECRTGTAR